jgi:hypothetical protein
MKSGNDYEKAMEYNENNIINVIGPAVFEIILQNELHDFIARTKIENMNKIIRRRHLKKICEKVFGIRYIWGAEMSVFFQRLK